MRNRVGATLHLFFGHAHQVSAEAVRVDGRPRRELLRRADPLVRRGRVQEGDSPGRCWRSSRTRSPTKTAALKRGSDSLMGRVCSADSSRSGGVGAAYRAAPGGQRDRPARAGGSPGAGSSRWQWRHSRMRWWRRPLESAPRASQCAAAAASVAFKGSTGSIAGSSSSSSSS